MQAAACSGVQPGKSAAKPINVELPAPEVLYAYICNFEFATSRWFQIFCYGYDIVIKNIKPWNSVVAFGLCRLFLYRNCPTVGAEFDNAIALRVTYLITKNRCTAVEIGKRVLKSVAAVKNVIAKNQRYCIIPYK